MKNNKDKIEKVKKSGVTNRTSIRLFKEPVQLDILMYKSQAWKTSSKTDYHQSDLSLFIYVLRKATFTSYNR